MATGFALIGRELDADSEAGSNVGALAKKSGVASRLAGVSPSDVAVLLVHARRAREVAASRG